MKLLKRTFHLLTIQRQHERAVEKRSRGYRMQLSQTLKVMELSDRRLPGYLAK